MGAESECLKNKKVSINLSVPEDIALKYGFHQDEEYDIREYMDGIFVRQSPDMLKRIYLEVTNQCNLKCKTCIRNVWDEKAGKLNYKDFHKIIEDTEKLPYNIITRNNDNILKPRKIKQPFTFVFGGWGEPLIHPDIFRMIKEIKKRSWRAELITNGTLLNKDTVEKLIEAGLDLIWVSLDGAKPESYKDVRLGNMLPDILENLNELKKIKTIQSAKTPALGIAFVAMKSNIADLPGILDICRKAGALKLSVSNVLPFTKELVDERLYKMASGIWREKGDIEIAFPRIDVSDEVSDIIRAAAESAGSWYSIACDEKDHRIGVCPFIKKASLSIRWDGKVSPCTPLFYDSQSYLDETLRRSDACHFGDVTTESLSEIWMKDDYRELRKKLQGEGFSPCSYCNACEMAEDNGEDCFGNGHPSCGGCLWQQGFIQCP